MDKTLLLVDGSSYLYRAFHALPDLRNAAGEPTGAIYGVVNMLRRLRKDYPASRLACVFDAPGATFRHDLYPDYKANRTAMPEDLATQIAAIHEIVKAQGWPIIMLPGIEADDVIGTLARQATEAGMQTIISTGDKDLAQLVDDTTLLINTMSNERLDIAGVRQKFGVEPSQIVDYLTLVGDSVDNIPGVDKVGPKTAAKWLKQYQSLEGVLAHQADIGGVVGDNLRRATHFLPLAQQLVTVKTDCDLSSAISAIEDLQPLAVDREKLLVAYARYAFKAWLKELNDADIAASLENETAGDGVDSPPVEAAAINTAYSAAGASPGATPREVQYHLICDWTTFDYWFETVQAADLVAIDTETTSLNQLDARLVGISLAINPFEACYLPLAHDYAGVPEQLPIDGVLERLRPWLADAQRRKVLQNAKYDMQVFANHGLSLQGVVHDTLLQSYVLESHLSPGLNAIAKRWLGVEGVSYEALCGKGAHQIAFSQVSLEQAGHYAAEDADFTLRAHLAMWPQIEAAPGLKTIYALEMQVMPIIAQIERTGVLIDPELLKQQSVLLEREMRRLEAEAYTLAGQPFNLNSPKQLGEILFQVLKLPIIRKTANGAPSTDEEALSKLAETYPLPKILLSYRSLAKLKSTYTDKLPRMIHADSGRVHTNYGQALVVTGRLSSSEPNLQNIPVRHPEGRRIRDAFIAPHGTRIVSADYSQVELRILAHLSEDPGLLRAFSLNEDVHQATAAEIFDIDRMAVTKDQRRSAKIINFGLIYGMSAFGLAQALNIDREAAAAYIKRYFERYPAVQNYMNQTRAMASAQGYIETVFGRRLWFPDLKGANGARRASFERAAINAPMQGTAADLIKMAMIAVHDYLNLKNYRTRVVMQVHDELVLEVPLDELDAITHNLPSLMSDVAVLKVPLLVEVGQGRSWGQAH